MSRYFELLPSAASNYEIVARHPYSLPGITCDRCGATWSQTGMAFPEVPLPESFSEKPYRSLAPVSVEEFEKLAAQVHHFFPDGLDLRPGLEFGRLKGEVVRMDASDLLWLNPWTLLARKQVGDVLATRLGMTIVQAELRGVAGDPGLVELSIHPRGSADLEPTEVPCVRCGRVAATRKGKLRVRVRAGEQIPAIFRLSNFPTIVIGAHSFVDLLRSEDWTGVETQEVELVQ